MLVNNISLKTLGGAWVKVLDKAHYQRRGKLIGSTFFRTEIAFDSTGTGVMLVPVTGIELTLDAHTELWARREGGGFGFAELFGQMTEV